MVSGEATLYVLSRIGCDSHGGTGAGPARSEQPRLRAIAAAVSGSRECGALGHAGHAETRPGRGGRACHLRIETRELGRRSEPEFAAQDRGQLAHCRRLALVGDTGDDPDITDVEGKRRRGLVEQCLRRAKSSDPAGLAHP